jgi:hypothetical protein
VRRVPELVWWIGATVVGLAAAGLCAWLAVQIPPGKVTIRVADQTGDFTTDLNWFWAGMALMIVIGLVTVLLWRFSDLLRDRIWSWRTVRAVKRARDEGGAEAPRQNV